MMSKKNEKNWKVLTIIIFCIIGVVIETVGCILAFSVNAYLGASLFVYGMIIILLAVFVIPCLYYVYIFCMHLINNKNWLMKYTGVGLISGTIIIVLGIAIIISNAPFTDNYRVDSVKVLESHWNKIVIDYTNYNKGDYSVLEIKKPFFVILNEGDIVKVKYPINEPKKMYYVFDDDETISVNMLLCGSVIIALSFLLPISCLMIETIRATKGKDKNGKK